MSHARQRRARRYRAAVQNLTQSRGNLVAFAAAARRIAATDVCLWRAAAAAEQAGAPLDDDERAVLARAIDPRRAPTNAGSVTRRQNFVRRP